MSSIFTPEQRENIRLKYHPDCGQGDPCPACGARETPGGGACPGQPSALAQELWLVAICHDHNADPERVLHTATQNDAALLDRAARAIFTTVLAVSQ